MNSLGEQCESASFLPPQLRKDVLQTYPSIDRRLVEEDLACVLAPHTDGEHYALLYDHFPAPIMGALWTRWQDDELPDSFWIRPDCPATSPQSDACAHFLAHPGAHTWASP